MPFDISNPPLPSVSDIKGDLSNALNISSQQSGAKSTAGIVANPWDTLNNPVNSRFFKFIQIDPDRWDQLFPYRLIVVDTFKNNAIVGGGDASKLETSVSKGASSAQIDFTSFGYQWIFQLPISPQQLNITDQYAITTTPTLRGILEEHSGVRFKLINAQGTMGVWPGRASLTSPPSSPSILQSIFGGTIEAAQSLVGQVQGLINTATSGHSANSPISKRPETTTNGYASTGYYYAMALEQFLEQYAEAKTNPKNAGWRLVFDIPKQNQSFVVTPMQYNWIQSAQKPMEIGYSFQLKAWRRIDLKEQPPTTKPGIQPVSPGVMAQILNTISQARNVTSSAINLIGAVRSDVEAPLNALRQTSLLIKGIIGVVVTAADLPAQLAKDYSSGIKDAINNLSSSISSNSSDPSVVSSLNAIKASKAAVEGLSNTAVANGQLGNTAALAQSIDPANNVLNAPEANFALFDQVPISSVVLTPSQQRAVDNVVQEANALTIDDIRGFRATIQQLAVQLSNNFGTGDAFYSKTYNQPTPIARLEPITLDEYDILKALYDAMSAYDILTASTQLDDNNVQSPMQYVAGLADQAGIPFNIPTSKILAPVPFGLTIEAIALRYLGDPERWIEIATLNGLRDPYIDETGFTYALLSNATGRQITIGSINSLYVGQRVLINSATQPVTARKILNIDQLSSTSFLITLDGLANLDTFTLSDKAYLQAYLPGTVNSQQKIYIPSALPVSDDPNITPPNGTTADPLTGLSKVDLLLTDTGDLAINGYGDLRYSWGITNIIQALKIKIGTARSSLLTHPEFGLGISPGISLADLNTNDLFKAINLMIQQDPRFNGVTNLQITLDGPTLTINMGVAMAGNQGVFPVNFVLTA